MGMASSQARLLELTARIHDTTLQAQHIMNDKILLATQKDQLFQDYCDKLDAKKIQIATGFNGLSRTYVDATFDNVCKYDPTRTQQYALKLADTGKIVVDSDVANKYKYFSNDRYAFAWAMLGLGGQFNWELDKDGHETYYLDGSQGQYLGVNTDVSGGENYEFNTHLLMTEVEEIVYNNHQDNLSGNLKSAYEKYNEAEPGSSEQWDAFLEFRENLYSSYGGEIYQYMILDKSDNENRDPENGQIVAGFPENFSEIKSEFDYYLRLFDEIHSAGGCVCVDDYAGEDGTNNEWFNQMINSGTMLIDMWVDSRTGWQETSLATCTTNNYIQEVQDETDLKKIEAEYEYELDIINSKDSKFDQDLKNLETEKKALETERDSLKTVISENEERTFGIFS